MDRLLPHSKPTTATESEAVFRGTLTEEVVAEADRKEKRLVARGEFARWDRPTSNGRLYGRSVWEKEAKRLAQHMAEGKMIGETNHPQDGQSDVDKTSHWVRSIKVLDDGRVIGEAVILDTDRGRNLKAIFQGGGRVGVSSRGRGSIVQTEEGVGVVQDDFELDTFDFVKDPAVSTAYPDVFLEHRMTTTTPKSEPTQPAPSAVSAQSLNEARAEGVKLGREAADAEFRQRLPEIVRLASEQGRTGAKAELLADPAVAGAKTVVESIVSLLKPYGLSESDATLVDEARAETAKVRAELAQSIAREAAAQDALNAERVKSWELASNLWVERELRTVAEANEIRAILGKPESYPDAATLKVAFADACARHKAVAEQHARAEAAVQAEKAALQEAHTRHQSEVQRLAEQAEQARQTQDALARRLAEAAKLKAISDYVLREALALPDTRAVLHAVEQSAPTSLEEAEALLARFRAAAPAPVVESSRAALAERLSGGHRDTVNTPTSPSTSPSTSRLATVPDGMDPAEYEEIIEASRK